MTHMETGQQKYNSLPEIPARALPGGQLVHSYRSLNISPSALMDNLASSNDAQVQTYRRNTSAGCNCTRRPAMSCCMPTETCQSPNALEHSSSRQGRYITIHIATAARKKPTSRNKVMVDHWGPCARGRLKQAITISTTSVNVMDSSKYLIFKL
ncbi:hypothetical protein FIBSPDRAFT_881783 [Athelia psychrophila]|uniref:Uncharacterized protein n=1 Tax=Athelia psychrophila TaxID=1759441 RepID=A0A166WCR5_9AGAM|nr:hypothetical protein FIBSPDRAFT_881783 [Fibularhizoctonia sp. CBS 109695]